MQNRSSQKGPSAQTPIAGAASACCQNQLVTSPKKAGMAMRVAVYARYSTDDQKESSIEDQIHTCRETARRFGLELTPSLIFSDSAISGQAKKTLKRTQYQAMRAAIRNGEVDVLICDQQCRLARSAKESLNFFDELKDHRVRLLTADGLDSEHPTSQLLFGIKSVFSEFFVDETRHRVGRSMQGEFDRGSMITSIPYGYKKDVLRSNASGHCYWTVCQDEATVVREIFLNRKNGMSLNQIAAILNGRSVPTSRQKTDETPLYWRAAGIWRLLQCAVYKGVYQVNFAETKTHARREAQRMMSEFALVSTADWDICQAMGKRSPAAVEGVLVKGVKGPRATYGGGKHPLAGVFRCGTCGVNLSCHHSRTDAGTMHCIQCEHATNVGLVGRQPLYVSIKGLRVLLRWLLDHVLSVGVVKHYRAQLRKRLAGGREGELQSAQQDLEKAQRSQARLARLLRDIDVDDALLEAQYSKTRTDVLELGERSRLLALEMADMNEAAIRLQLGVDLSTVVDAFLNDKVAPERTRALLNRIFPALILRGKTDRFTAIFEVHVKPGAILAEATTTPELVNGCEVLWVRLITSGSKYPSWSVEVMEAPDLTQLALAEEA